MWCEGRVAGGAEKNGEEERRHRRVEREVGGVVVNSGKAEKEGERGVATDRTERRTKAGAGRRQRWWELVPAIIKGRG